jgi:S-adenosylmethionine decarboxylase
MNQVYNPGKHVLITVRSVPPDRLTNLSDWSTLIENQIKKHQLHCLGKVQHRFEDSGGYTAVHCLTESHISVHTWPEFQLSTCDVFLSNFQKDNSLVVQDITKTILDYFCSDIYDLKELSR